MMVQNSLMRSMSTLPIMLARSIYGLMTGTGFGGTRDYYQIFGYNRTPTHTDFVAKYLTQDIATRVIEAPVRALWNGTPELKGNAAFVADWNKLVKEHSIYSHVAQADIFVGLGQYAVLLIGIDDGQPLSTPVMPTDGKRRLLYLQPYLEGSVDILKLDENPMSPRFGLPHTYKITPGNFEHVKNSSYLQGGAKRGQSFEVHWSRILHLADRTLECSWVGNSRLRSVYNTLDDIMKVTGGSAETFWTTGNRGIHVDVDKEMELEPDDAADLSAEIEEYQNGLRRFIRSRGVKVTNLGSDVADPKNVFFVLISLLASNTNIPQRVLMGAEAGQLASQQDRANWAVHIRERANLWGWPRVLRPFILRLADMGVISQPGSGLDIEWQEFFQMNPLERGQTSAQQARSITNVARAMDTAQKMQVELISVEEAREMVAPGRQLLVLSGTPKGTFPPAFSAPKDDPANKLAELEKTAEIAEKQAETAKTEAENAVTVDPAVPAQE